jgi:hypothetical protein
MRKRTAILASFAFLALPANASAHKSLAAHRAGGIHFVGDSRHKAGHAGSTGHLKVATNTVATIHAIHLAKPHLPHIGHIKY